MTFAPAVAMAASTSTAHQPASNQSLEDILAEVTRVFVAAEIEHVVFGGVASSALGRPRTTGDIDILIRPDAARTALELLREEPGDLPVFGFIPVGKCHRYQWLFRGISRSRARRHGARIDARRHPRAQRCPSGNQARLQDLLAERARARPRARNRVMVSLNNTRPSERVAALPQPIGDRGTSTTLSQVMWTALA